MKRKNLDKIIHESIKKVLSERKTMIAEMAKINLKDGGDSEFPSNAYRVWVQGDNSPHKPPHMHIKSIQEGWIIRVLLETGKLWSVEAYGNRGENDMFVDVIKKVNTWFKKPTLMPGRIGTNQEAALNEWEACNS